MTGKRRGCWGGPGLSVRGAPNQIYRGFQLGPPSRINSPKMLPRAQTKQNIHAPPPASQPRGGRGRGEEEEEEKGKGATYLQPHFAQFWMEWIWIQPVPVPRTVRYVPEA